MRLRNEKASIYGLFDCVGLCLYVGQTIRPNSRMRQHIMVDNARFKDTKFKVLRQTTHKQVDRLERQIMLAYQRKGQAQFSKRFNVSTFKRRTRATVYIIEGETQVFRSMVEVAQYAGISAGCVANNLGEPNLLFKNKVIHEVWRETFEPVPWSRNKTLEIPLDRALCV